MANGKTTKWFIIYLVLYSLFELSKRVITPDCGNDFIPVNRHQWRCKGKLHNTHSTTQGKHDNNILHSTIENPPNSLVNNDIDSNHGEGHLTSYNENQNQNKSNNDFTCYCSKKCKCLRGLRVHQRSCFA